MNPKEFNDKMIGHTGQENTKRIINTMDDSSRNIPIIPALELESSMIHSEPAAVISMAGATPRVGKAMFPPLQPAYQSHLGIFTARSMEDIQRSSEKSPDGSTSPFRPGVKKSSSLENITRLPPIKDKRESYPKVRMKARQNNNHLSISTALNDSHPMLKSFEKIAYTKPLHQDLPPAPTANSQVSRGVKEKSFMDKKRRRQRLETIGILNTLPKCVEYFEHHGRVSVLGGGNKNNTKGADSDWSYTDCTCYTCTRQRQRWTEEERMKQLEVLRSKRHQKWRTPYAHTRRRTTVTEEDEDEEL